MTCCWSCKWTVCPETSARDVEKMACPKRMCSEKTMPEKRIRDIMLELDSFQRISPRRKALDAVKMLGKRARGKVPRFLLVVDKVGDKEEILGVVSVDDVLGRMEPSTGSMEELPIFWQGQFYQECESLFERTSSEIMSPVTRVIHQSGTLMEAVHLMNSGKFDWLPVVEGEDVVGILLKEDLFKEVLAATESEAGAG